MARIRAVRAVLDDGEGVYVVQSPKTRGGEGLPKLWTHHEIQTQRQSFLRNVKEAVTGKREIYCQGSRRNVPVPGSARL